MLKNIPPILSPTLLKVLCEMGHGDRIVLADGNFPAESVGKNAIVVRCDGHGVLDILDAVLTLMPLDDYVEKPVSLMALVPGDTAKTPIWKDIYATVARHDARGEGAVQHVERFAYYGQAQTAYAVVATGEVAVYANVMLQKGVVRNP